MTAKTINSKFIVLLMAVLGMAFQLSAQSIRTQLSVSGGLTIPNGQLRDLNLLRTGSYLGFGIQAEKSVTKKFGVIIQANPNFSRYTKNPHRIPSDCLDQPCVTFESTQDSLRGRDLSFLSIPVSIGGSLHFGKNYSVWLSTGVNLIAKAWVEEGTIACANGKSTFANYSPESPIAFHRINGIVSCGFARHFALSENLGLFIELTSQVLYTPMVVVVGTPNYHGDFSLRPSSLGLKFGVEI